MSDDPNVIQLKDIKARAAGVSPELADVVRQINERFRINIELTDPRLSRFKKLFPALSEAAAQEHEVEISPAREHVKRAIRQGVDAGRAQMMMDVIVCILEQDGLLQRK